MTKKVLILVATMSGTAETVADELADFLENIGWQTQIVRMDEIGLEDLRPGTYLVCTSTYGTGDVPDNAKSFFECLVRSRPDLKGVRYGLVGLGDSIYAQTFCFGGKRFDEILSKLGATRIGDRLDHDRRSPTYPEDAALAWVKTWIECVDADDVFRESA